LVKEFVLLTMPFQNSVAVDADSGELREVSLVSVTYRSAALLEFFKETAAQFPNVVVVDNHSEDGSVERLRRELTHAQVISLPSNIGFGPANNVGLAKVDPSVPYVLFLNPDCRIERADVLQLLRALKRNPDAAVACPVMQDGTGSIIRPKLRPYSLGYRHSVARDFKGDLSQPQVVQGVCIDGACFLVDAAKFREVGGFDDQIFMYFEEDDIALRMARQGYAVLLDTSASAMHMRGTSTRNTMRILIRRAYHFRWSKYYLTNAHLGVLARLGGVVKYLTLSVPRMLWYLLTLDKPRLARAIGWLLASLDGIFMTRLFRFL
jgi:N-acetylglucosaminyl-diphospho-decaprenol L-rhamnosyltransferase